MVRMKDEDKGVALLVICLLSMRTRYVVGMPELNRWRIQGLSELVSSGNKLLLRSWSGCWETTTVLSKFQYMCWKLHTGEIPRAPCIDLIAVESALATLMNSWVKQSFLKVNQRERSPEKEGAGRSHFVSRFVTSQFMGKSGHVRSRRPPGWVATFDFPRNGSELRQHIAYTWPAKSSLEILALYDQVQFMQEVPHTRTSGSPSPGSHLTSIRQPLSPALYGPCLIPGFLYA
jgi:hypothetical protein